MDRLRHPKSICQILTLLAFCLLLIAVARLVQHETDDTFIDFWDYIASFHIAVPPLAIILGTYGLGLLAGKSLSEVPVAIVSRLRNQILQSYRSMLVLIGMIMIVSLAILNYTERYPAPAYEEVVRSILSGEVDRSDEALRLIDKVAAKNEVLADRLRLVQQVFELRRKINLEARTNSVVEARLLVRALENAPDRSWNNHPLRKHALAEAYSILAQGMGETEKIGIKLSNLTDKALYARAVGLYRAVIAARNSNLWTRQLGASAQNNIGNVYYYQGKNEDALREWGAVEKNFPEHKSSGTLANMVAANILLNRFDEAIRVGTEARLWAEANGDALQNTSGYVSILVNTGYGFLARNQPGNARPYFEVSSIIEDDDNTKLDAALSYAMAQEPKRAESLLRKVSAPLGVEIGKDQGVIDAKKKCSYLLWGVYSDETDRRVAAANLHAFLGEKHSRQEMEIYADKGKFAELKRRVAAQLGASNSTCSSYAFFPSILRFITR